MPPIPPTRQSTPVVAVVVHFRGADDTLACVASLRRQQPAPRIVVVDNVHDPAQQLVPELALDEMGDDGLFMAFSLKTPDALVERCRAAFERLRRAGRLPRPGSGQS